MEAVFLGAKDSKIISKEDALKNDCIYLFKVGNEVKEYYLLNIDKKYSLHNKLIKNHKYDIELFGNIVLSATVMEKSKVEGIVENYLPGEKTIKNYLSIAIAPLGKTLYVYGGGWNFQDNGSSIISRTIGLSPTWEDYYNSTDENYSYKKDTYPNNGWNEYYYAGLDCSGYISWIIYNTMYNKTEEKEGFTGPSTIMAKNLSKNYGYGTITHPTTNDYRELSKMLKPGDIVSIRGHIYIVLGRCNDDSLVIIHSTVTDSISNVKGGGVQMSAISINRDNDPSCEAFELVKSYMEEYYPEWSQRYPPVVKPASIYLSFPEELPDTGIFSWYIGDKGLEDPENIKNMNAEEVLQTIFEARIKTKKKIR